MRPDRDREQMERADSSSDPLADDPSLRRVVSDLDALYSQPQPPMRLLLPQDWSAARPSQPDQGGHSSARRVVALSGASRRSTRGGPMSPREKSIRPRRAQVLAASVAALIVVGLLGFLLTRGAPTKQPPAGSTATAAGDAATLQQFAQQGGASILLDLRCLPGVTQCDTSALVSQFETTLRKRIADAGVAKAVFFQEIDSRTLSLLIPGLKDDNQALSLVSNIGQVNIIDTGATQIPIGTSVTVCPASASACPAGAYHVVFTGQQIAPTSVSADLDRQTNLPIVTFAFKPDVRASFASYTRSHIGETLTITLDGMVIESATIQSEIDGQAQISGFADEANAQHLAAKLKDGPLPLDSVIESQQIQAPLSCPPASNGGQPLGVPAITPRIAHPASGQPAYTATDARAYVEAHTPGSHASIANVYQLSALQAAVLFDGECTGLPDSSPVFVVQLTGDFGPIDAPGVAHSAPGTHYAAETFDGVTGNLIMTTNLPK